MSEVSPVLWIASAAVAVRILLAPTSFSTDFEVHRNWKALTHNLHPSQWYYESTSPWTLDYPPLFAFFEYLLSWLALIADPNMLAIKNLDYSSPAAVLFMRASVVACDAIFFLGAWSCIDALHPSKPHWMKVGLFAALAFNPGLLIVDHIHFQYNGFVLGFLLLAVAATVRGKMLMAAVLFSCVLTLKHTYLLLVPVFTVTLLRHYCMLPTAPTDIAAENMMPSLQFSIDRFVRLGSVTAAAILTPFLPFLAHIQQIITRLFPFGRGLTHSYWAPNFWALYSAMDRALLQSFRILKLPLDQNKIAAAGAATRGLVSNGSGLFSVLPNISPSVSAALTIVLTYTLSAKSYDSRVSSMLAPGLALSALCGYIVGWHVHEKAILVPIVLLSLSAPLSPKMLKSHWILSLAGYLSLFPLLQKFEESLIKWLIVAVYCPTLWIFYKEIASVHKEPATPEPVDMNEADSQVRSHEDENPKLFLNSMETLQIAVMVIVVLVCDMVSLTMQVDSQHLPEFISSWINVAKRMPFLWLMGVSLATSIPIHVEWIRLLEEYMSG